MRAISTAAFLAALLAPSARAGGGCVAPPAQADEAALTAVLRACFPHTDAPEVFLLNEAGGHHDIKVALNEFEMYVDDHELHRDKYELADVTNPDGTRPRVEHITNYPLIPPGNWATVAPSIEKLFDIYSQKLPGTPPIRTASPVNATAAGPGPKTPREPTIADQFVSHAATMLQDPGLITVAAQSAADRGDYKTAYARFASIPQGGAPNPAALIGMANADFAMGNYAGARETAAKALRLVPDDQAALSLYHLAVTRIPKADLKSAASWLGGDAPSPGAPGAGFARAAARASRAPANAGKASSAAPTPANAERTPVEMKVSQLALTLGDPSEAVDRADRALELDPGNAQALVYRAAALSRQGRYAEAERDATAALTLNPNDLTARKIRLWARARQGHWNDALSDADAFVAAAPSSADAHYGRAFALAGLGDKASALAELKRAADLDPAFQAKYAEAVQLPQDADLALLFGGEFDQSKAPASAAPASRAPTPATIAAASGAALLIVLAVLLIFAPQKFATLRRPVPALASSNDALHGRYRIGRRIGSGGMGVVYQAQDLSLDRRVALKKIRDENRLDERERERFLQEARTVARLKHPNIVDIYSVFEEGGDTYLALEFVEGRTLHELIASKVSLGYDEALGLLRPMCAAVEHAHAAQVIHRDLKPANVMVTTQGIVKVMDFGVARRVQETAAKTMRTNTVVGTPPYMAPEQEQGKVRRESDTYALAVCFYEMTTGRLPFAGSASGMALNKLQGNILPSSGSRPLPAGFDAAMARALAPDPERRLRTPAELLAEFQALA